MLSSSFRLILGVGGVGVGVGVFFVLFVFSLVVDSSVFVELVVLFFSVGGGVSWVYVMFIKRTIFINTVV